MSTLAKPRFDFSNQEIVKVEVGKDAIVFLLHKDILTKTSSFFKAAFDGSFKESVEKTIRLEDTDREVFGLYVDWLYSGCICWEPQYENNWGNSGSEVDEQKDFELGGEMTLQLLRLGMFADQYQDLHFARAVIDHLKLRDIELKITSNTIQWVYENTSKPSELRAVVLDRLLKIHHATEIIYELAANDEVSVDFWENLAIRCLLRVQQDHPPCPQQNHPPCTEICWNADNAW